MTVDDPGTIDAAGIDRLTDEVVLTIFDHFAWNDTREHLLTLQEKLNRYLGFLEAGEMVEAYPEGIGKKVRIDVIFRHHPPTEAEDFLKSAAVIALEYEATLTWRVYS